MTEDKKWIPKRGERVLARRSTFVPATVTKIRRYGRIRNFIVEWVNGRSEALCRVDLKPLKEAEVVGLLGAIPVAPNAVRHLAERVEHMLSRPRMYSGSPEVLDGMLKMVVEDYLAVIGGDSLAAFRLWRKEIEKIEKIHPTAGAMAMSLADVGDTDVCKKRRAERVWVDTKESWNQVTEGWRRIWTTLTNPVAALASIEP